MSSSPSHKLWSTPGQTGSDTSSPSRSTRVNSPANSRQRSSPRRRTSIDSPSRQLIEEFMHFVIETDRSIKERHDQENEALERTHRKQLDASQKHHAAIIARAERAHETARQQREADLLRKLAAEQEAFERSKRELAEAEAQRRRQELDALEAQEQEQRQRMEHARLIAEKQAQLRANEERAQREKSTREDLEAKQKAEALAREQADRAAKEASASAASKPEPIKPTIANITTPTPTTTNTATPSASAAPVTAAITQNSSSPLLNWQQLKQEHDSYIKLHGDLKKMRKHMSEMYKKAQQSKRSTGRADPPIEEMADLRRQIQKNLGQLTQDPQKNKKIRAQIRDIVRAAWNNKGVMLDARTFIINPTQPFPDNADTQVSGVFVYIINILIKAAMKLMPTSASILTYNAVDAIGVVLTFVVSLSEFRVGGNSFADIYLAKYHNSCPPLFGIYGPDNTQGGRVRLGWQRDKDEGTFADPQRHYDRINGVASGFAALTLRDFSRTRETNALPAWHYWRALSAIVNVPPAQLTKTHAVILRAIIDQYANHFVKFYGHAAIAALRLAIIQIPAQAPESAGFDAVKVVRDNLKTNFGLEI